MQRIEHRLDAVRLHAADIELENRFAGDLGEARFFRRGENAKGTDELMALGFESLPMVVEAAGKFGKCDGGIAAIASRGCAGVVVFTNHPAGTQATGAGDAGHDANGNFLGIQDRALFDVEFQVGGGVLGRQAGVAGASPIGIEALVAHMVGKAAAGVEPLDVEGGRWKATERGVAAGVGGWEPSAGFLGTNGHDGDVARGCEPGGTHAGDRGQSGKDTGGAIVVSAMPH